MELHANARLSVEARRLLCRRVRELRWKVTDAAFAGGISERPAHGWSARFHIRTRRYRPRMNGKTARFIQTLLREGAYAATYRDG